MLGIEMTHARALNQILLSFQQWLLEGLYASAVAPVMLNLTVSLNDDINYRH
jgi:hypothetical protein